MRRSLLSALALASLSSAVAASPVRTLPNGLRYVVIEDRAAPVVSLQIWVRCGGVNEEGPTAGVSHFLEHMIFKGTEKISANEISKVVESNGGSINAATGGETTHYYIDMPADQWRTAFRVLSESVLFPAFPPEEFERERHVILEEIKRRNDDPRSYLWDGFMKTLFPRTAYKNQVIGSAETIKAMTREMMVDQHKAFYVPNNMVVVVVGNAPKREVEKEIKAMFGKVPPAQLPEWPALLEGPLPDPVVTDIINPKAQQAHVAVGFVGPTLLDPDQVAMDVLATTLGGGQSSPLYHILREEKRVVWSVGASFITHAGTGVFGIFAECPPERVRGLPNDIYFILHDQGFMGFKSEDVDRAKTQLRTSWLFGQETYHGQASRWGFFTALGAPGLVDSYLKKLEKVTPKDLERLLTNYGMGRPLAGVAVKPSANGRP